MKPSYGITCSPCFDVGVFETTASNHTPLKNYTEFKDLIKKLASMIFHLSNCKVIFGTWILKWRACLQKMKWQQENSQGKWTFQKKIAQVWTMRTEV